MRSLLLALLLSFTPSFVVAGAEVLFNAGNQNLIIADGNFENCDTVEWTGFAGNDSFASNSNNPYSGSCSAEFSVNQANGTGGFYQVVDVVAGEEYTLFGQISPPTSNTGRIRFRLANDADEVDFALGDLIEFEPNDNGYRQNVVTGTVPSGVTNMRIEVSGVSASGITSDYYVDNLKLITGLYPYSSELISNGHFERGDTGWFNTIGVGTHGVSTIDSYEGGYSYRTDTSTSDDFNGIWQTEAGLSEGETLIVSSWGKVSTNGGDEFYIKLRETGEADDTELVRHVFVSSGTTDWVHQTFDYTVPAGIASVDIMCGGPVTGTRVGQCDNISVKKRTTALPLNQIENGGFETGDFNGWISHASDGVINDGTAEENLHHAQIENLIGGTSQEVIVSNGETYRYSCKIKVENFTDGVASVQFVYSADGACSGFSSIQISSDQDWIYHEREFTVTNSDCIGGVVRFHQTVAGGMDYYVDDVKFEKVN